MKKTAVLDKSCSKRSGSSVGNRSTPVRTTANLPG